MMLTPAGPVAPKPTLPPCLCLPQAILSNLDPELRPLARPLMGWLAVHFDQAVARQVCCSSSEEAEVRRWG